MTRLCETLILSDHIGFPLLCCEFASVCDMLCTARYSSFIQASGATFACDMAWNSHLMGSHQWLTFETVDNERLENTLGVLREPTLLSFYDADCPDAVVWRKITAAWCCVGGTHFGFNYIYQKYLEWFALLMFID